MNNGERQQESQSTDAPGVTPNYPNQRHKQIEVTSSSIARETNELAPGRRSSEDDAKPMFLTYYNQECNGVMVAMLDNTTVLQATDECLKLGCKAVNAHVHSDGRYTVSINGCNDTCR
ncbi:unnamed protein product [Strongylus vulgaris]|uniref:Uncharacterized protein n=1 Tax=Strongylus vulgaris TaxID=40348 RepID=A0A3P7J585_STRVU|nr:unnamed protein product [Strongylus vulgaris]